MKRSIVTGFLCFVLGSITSWLAVNLYSSLDATVTGASVLAPHRSLRSLLTPCDDMPEPGTTSVLDIDGLTATGSVDGYFVLRNALAVPVVAVLMSDVDSHVLQVLTVAPGAGATTLVPQGHYTFGLLSGTAWCNLSRGFRDGQKTNVIGGLSVAGGATSAVSLASDPSTGRLKIGYSPLTGSRASSVVRSRWFPPATLVAWAGTTSYLENASSAVHYSGPQLILTIVSTVLIWLLLSWFQQARTPRLTLFRRPINTALGDRSRAFGGISESQKKRLLLLCGGNWPQVYRLISYERKRMPGISESEAAERAADRLEYERRG